MGNDVILRKQPGCWLRSSHSFKECVIAHWSSEVARKITGAKLFTEIADLQHLIKPIKITNFLLEISKIFPNKILLKISCSTLEKFRI